MDQRISLYDTKSGSILPIFDSEPLLSSQSWSGEDFVIEKTRREPMEHQDVNLLDHTIFMQLDGFTDLEWNSNGRSLTCRVLPGQVSFVPADVPFSCRIKGEGEFLYLTLKKRFFNCAAAHYGVFGVYDLHDFHAESDAFLSNLLVQFLKAVEAGETYDRVYCDSLAQVVTAYLLKNHASSKPPIEQGTSRLNRNQLRKAMDFVHDQLSNDINLQLISREVGLSPFHFLRSFKETTGMTPHEYVTKTRLEAARSMLLKGQFSLCEIASKTGFCDQSHLSRSFKKLYGMPPLKYSRNHTRASTFIAHSC